MNRDLEEFLRKAAERRAQKQAQRRQPVQSPPPTPSQPLAQQPPSPPQASSQRPAPAPVRTVQQPSVANRPSEMQAKRVGSNRVGQLSSASDNVDQADERMSQHLHQAFDHSLGDISAPSTATTADDRSGASAATENLAAEVLALLRDPQQVRKAIVLREILDRPEHRWS